MTSNFGLPSNFATVEPELVAFDTTEIHLSVENLFGEVSYRTPVIVIDKERRRQAQEKEAARVKEEARIAEEKRLAEVKRIARQRANLTVNTTVSGSRYGTPTKLYRDTIFGWQGCVPYVKAKTGIYRTLGNGARDGIQGYVPQVGAIGAVVGQVHAVYVTAVSGDQITFSEAGYLYDDGSWWVTQRTLSSSYFIGFIYE